MNYPNRIIKEGESDQDIIKAIQQQLIAYGIRDLEGTGVFGPKTKSAVKLFQATHRDSFGNPLVTDGKVGSITWRALFGDETVLLIDQTSDILLSEAVSVASSQVGIMEVPPGSNKGPEVNEYLASTGTAPGNYWCAAFVFWCFKKASENLGKDNPLVRTPGCLDHWNNTHGKKINKYDAVNNPSLLKPGDIFINDYGNGKGHTGIIEKIENGFINTIEGNSNSDGSRNGIGVFRLERKIISINKGFIEY